MKHLQRWGAVWILVVLFLGSWLGQYFTMMAESGPFTWSAFWAATFENWQSEFLQLAVQAVLIASILQQKTFKADFSADKDDVAKIMAQLGKIPKRSEFEEV